MKTIINRTQWMLFHEFSEKHGLQLTIQERQSVTDPRMRYYARFQGAEVMSGGMLISKHGNGRTMREAARDYAAEISHTRIAIGAGTPQRREIDVPRLTFTKLP